MFLYVGYAIRWLAYIGVMLFTFGYLAGRDGKGEFNTFWDQATAGTPREPTDKHYRLGYYWDHPLWAISFLWPIVYLYLIVSYLCKTIKVRPFMEWAYDIGLKSKMPKEKKLRIENHPVSQLKDEYLQQVIDEELEDALINPKYKGASK